MYESRGRSTASTKLTNCILWANGTQMRVYGTNTASFSYSCIQGGVPSGVTDGGNNISFDPLFVSAAAGDYRLQAGSPCIGTGQGGVNMGAY